MARAANGGIDGRTILGLGACCRIGRAGDLQFESGNGLDADFGIFGTSRRGRRIAFDGEGDDDHREQDGNRDCHVHDGLGRMFLVGHADFLKTKKDNAQL